MGSQEWRDGRIPIIHFLNQNSFILAGLTVIALVAAFLLRDGVRLADFLALAGLAGGLFVAWLALRPGPSTVSNSSELQRLVGSGTPVLLELQSPY